MIENVIIIFKSIIPLIIYVFIGIYVALRYKYQNVHVQAFNTFIFHILMALNLFVAAYDFDVQTENIAKICLVCTVTIILMCTAGAIIARQTIKDNKKAAAFATVCWKSNFTMLGIPIANALLSSEGYSVFAVLTVLATALGNIFIVPQLAIVVKSENKKSLISLLKDIIQNPLIIGTILGFISNALSLKIPQIIYDPIYNLSKCASPIAMITIGFSIGIRHGIKEKKFVSIAALCKLVISPIIFASSAYICGIRGPAMGAICIIGALPCAMNSGIIVENMGGDGTLANEATFTMTIFSGITLFILGVILRTLGWA